MFLHKVVNGIVHCTALLNRAYLRILQRCSRVHLLIYTFVLHSTDPITRLQLLFFFFFFHKFESKLDNFDIDYFGCGQTSGK